VPDPSGVDIGNPLTRGTISPRRDRRVAYGFGERQGAARLAISKTGPTCLSGQRKEPPAFASGSKVLHAASETLSRRVRRVNRPCLFTPLPTYRFLSVLNFDSEVIDVDGLAVDLRPPFQKNLMCTRCYSRKQDAVAVGLGEIVILRSKRNLSIGALYTIAYRPHSYELTRRGIGLRAERDHDAAFHGPTNGEVDQRCGNWSECAGQC